MRTQMSGVDDDPVVECIPLANPRPLTANERALIDFLLQGPLGRDELRTQAETARVVGTCSCRCPSVWLDVDPESPIAEFQAEHSPSGDPAWVPITAVQPTRTGGTEVTLHVLGGRIHELEIWAGGYGVRPRVDPARLECKLNPGQAGS